MNTGYMEFFKQISNIPRGSGNEKQLSDFLVDFAKERNLWVHQDKEFNVIIKKAPSKGYENCTPVIIQGHLDMVCEKNNDKIHNFETDPIELVVDGDFLRANGTTLGADNGIAVAMAMAVLDGDYPCPPIEVMLTTNEETGLTGATEIDGKLFQGKTLINIDSEEEGYFYTSCAGGLKAKVILPLTHCKSTDYSTYLIEVKGLVGGHSGMEINKERGNSNVVLARILNEILLENQVSLIEFNGGLKDNAIPREAIAYINIKDEIIDKTTQLFNKIVGDIKNELKMSDSCVSISLNKVSKSDKDELTYKSAISVISTILLLPNGVQAMSLNIANMVETSNNIGVVRTKDNTAEITCALRSSVKSKKDLMLVKVKFIANMQGGYVETRGEYPGWEYNPNSPIRELAKTIYKSMYGKDAHIDALHAGLECGVLAEKLEGLDIISLGPNITGAHTPEEQMSISSSDRVWLFLVELLKECKFS